MKKPKRKPKPRSWKAWAMLWDGHPEETGLWSPLSNERILMVTPRKKDLRLHIEASRYGRKIIRVRIEEVRPCPRPCPRQSRIEVTK